MNLKEFADTIGVSPSTISRSLSQRGRISDDTRLMVLQKAEELNYTPNLNAQRLVKGRTNTVALEFTGSSQLLHEMYFAQMISAILDALQSHSYDLLLGGQGARGVRHWVRSRAVDGVIVLADSLDAELTQEMAHLKTPCVVIGPHKVTGLAGVGSVVIDLGGGARQAARYLVEQKHQRIGFISSEAYQTVLPAFREELQKLNVTLSDRNVMIVGHSPAEGERAMRKLLSLPQRPTAVFARTDELAVGALRAARKMGVRVPEDISIIGHDDVPVSQLTEPMLTTVRVPCAQVGSAAVDMLLELLEQPVTAVDPFLIETDLVIRDSVTPVL
jgi:DNA-binding LacI/PurR family transcriptional regulator